MIKFITKNNKILYDIETIRKILKVSKSKIRRELKKQDCHVVKYKNLFLYEQQTLYNLMEIIIVEKIKENK